MGSIKDRNGLELTEAEDIKKRWQEYTEELYKKDLHDPDNHDGVITHLEPDILEYEVKWSNIRWIMEKAREFQKTSTSALLTMLKTLTVCITTNCGKFLKRWEYKPPYLLPEQPVYGQEATVRTRCETMNWFQVGKEVHQGCILPPCLFNLYAERIVQNAKLDEVQAGIKMVWRKINTIRYADDKILMAES